jgi:hypothetical protein
MRKDEMRGSLHCATDDETVRHHFCRDDDFFDGWKRTDNDKNKDEMRGSLHYGGKSAASGRDDDF